jgi:hypothetical protein
MTPKIGCMFAKDYARIFCLFWYNLYLYVYLNCLIVFNSKNGNEMEVGFYKGCDRE